MKVLVATTSSADDRKTLAAVNSLGLAGARVLVGTDRESGPVFRSPHCHGRVHLPHARDDQEGFVQQLVEAVRREGIDVVLPLSDATTFAVSRHRDAVEPHVRLPVPDHATLTRAHDKLGLARLAERLGIPVPRTWCPDGAEEWDAVARTVGYPCIFKLRRGAGGEGLRHPTDVAHLLRCRDELSGASDEITDRCTPLVQEFIPGEVHDACLLFNRGSVRAALSQRRLAMQPATGGIGVFNETTDEPLLREHAIRLLEALAWHGPAMVEFVRDERDGSFRLLEVNGRYWGTLQLSIDAGMNVPLLACRMALDGDVPSTTGYQVGLRRHLPLNA